MPGCEFTQRCSQAAFEPARQDARTTDTPAWGPY
jgi:hypothetical protein